MRLLITSVALLLAISLNGQTIERSVISSGGGSSTGGSMFVDITLGESATLYLANGNTQLDQGFQQTWMPGTTTSNNESLTEINTLDVYPNPAQQYIHLSKKVEQASVTITNLEGKTFFMKEIRSVQKLNVANIPSGVYIITIRTEEDVVVDKFIKE